MKTTKRQLRHIIREAIDPREMEEPRGGWIGDALTNDPDYPHPDDTDTSPQAWANEHGGEVDRDEEGQTIIHLSKEEYPNEGDIVGILPSEWDYGDDHDGEWTVYTGLYSAGSISRSHPKRRR